METIQEKMVLLEHVTGPFGEAYHWQHGPAASQELQENSQPMSSTVWTISLPDLDQRGLDDDENRDTGVFLLQWLNSNAEPWVQFKGKLPRYGRDFLLTLSEAWDPSAEAHLYDTCAADISESLLEEPADHLHVADQLMRLWVDELLAGRLHPYGGYIGHEDPADYFTGLMNRALSDPDAHLRNRVPPAPSNQPSLFGGES